MLQSAGNADGDVEIGGDDFAGLAICQSLGRSLHRRRAGGADSSA